jgi:hypothetical protein
MALAAMGAAAVPRPVALAVTQSVESTEPTAETPLLMAHSVWEFSPLASAPLLSTTQLASSPRGCFPAAFMPGPPAVVAMAAMVATAGQRLEAAVALAML